MSDAVPYLVLAGCLAVVMGFFTWLAVLTRRRGVAGSAVRAALASYEEAMRITAHDAHHEVRAQADRQAPVLSPDGPARGGRPVAGPGRPVRPDRRRPAAGRLRRLLGRTVRRFR
ncbi:hypothetical protein [Streptomyces morookaense]|uniref:Secreted protein n=1 Tax=Streptomyces morookaense TaxID=1970 RepID=A0A7Y7E9M0_STRMO|nr:hypothetical protein [Streptomyces morookaense]NVK80567.1 hypothetical protein [Streptomyces morookaense]GHF53812.1 hypothetical protein GCM10010359_65230 [Streptomyces morookaense]